MDKIDAIRKLREQVEGGSFPADTSARDIGLGRFCDDPGLPVINRMYGAFSGSLDAAKALHDALLPGKSWTVCPGGAGVDYSRHDYRAEADNDNPARAWLIAILRALEAQEGGE